jgi:hypothetical protein
MQCTPKTSIANCHHSTLVENLRDARPSLIVRVERQCDVSLEVSPFIVEVKSANDDVMDQGYDPHHSPLGCPVYWRIVKRRDGRFYYSTFQVSRDNVLKVWGPRGLSFCDPVTGSAVARIETRLPNPKRRK